MSNEEKNNIGLFIRQFRQKADLSQTELGQKVGVSQLVVSAWERGRYLPPADKLEAVEEALELPEGSLSSVEEAERQLKAIPQARLVAVDLYLDQILPILERLNRAGKMELIRRADELSRLPEYQKEG